MQEPLALTGMAVASAASFFFALSEAALFSLGPWQARELVEKAAKGGGYLRRLVENPQETLATIVLGNVLANGVLITLGLELALRGIWSLPWTLAGVFLVMLLGGEVVPKVLAVRDPDAWALRVAAPMVALSGAVRPLRALAERMNESILRALRWKASAVRTGLTDEEYQELLEMAYQQGTLEQSERDIILQIISLDKRTARDVMRARSQMACISDDLSLEEMMAEARRHGHRRLPMYDESPDTIVGILNTRTLLLNPAGGMEEAIEFPSFVPESMNLLQLLQSLQRSRRGMAIVLDEFGGTAGLVTTEDILESVVGEIRSETAPEGVVMERVGEGRWRVSGTLRIDDLRRECPDLEEVPGVETLGGLMAHLLEVVPGQGEKVRLKQWRFTATIVDERRVKEVLVERVGGGR